mmetsp:Transcript_10131/g.7600  ORF Transcript_10131/g.7600 Transcript_10131/m.7600 type:complete len:91 (+) Transcript_10131:796-1068(+)
MNEFLEPQFKTASLLYRATRDTFAAEAFHINCDGFKNMLILILSEHNKVFGGFTRAKFNQSEGYKYSSDSTAFIFSLTEGLKFPIRKYDV